MSSEHCLRDLLASLGRNQLMIGYTCQEIAQELSSCRGRPEFVVKSCMVLEWVLKKSLRHKRVSSLWKQLLHAVGKTQVATNSERFHFDEVARSWVKRKLELRKERIKYLPKKPIELMELLLLTANPERGKTEVEILLQGVSSKKITFKEAMSQLSNLLHGCTEKQAFEALVSRIIDKCFDMSYGQQRLTKEARRVVKLVIKTNRDNGVVLSGDSALVKWVVQRFNDGHRCLEALAVCYDSFWFLNELCKNNLLSYKIYKALLAKPLAKKQLTPASALFICRILTEVKSLCDRHRWKPSISDAEVLSQCISHLSSCSGDEQKAIVAQFLPCNLKF